MRYEEEEFDVRKFTDPTTYTPHTDFSESHDRGTFRSLHSHIPLKRIPENDMTDVFLDSLFVEIPKQGVLLKNIFVIGGPGTGKTTTQRAIGYQIAHKYPGDIVQCLESNYLPDALGVLDPTKKIFVISIDDPLKEQDARRPSEKKSLDATNAFLEIRHIVMKELLKHQVRQYLNAIELDKETEKFLMAYHDTPKILCKKFPKWVVEVGGIIFTIFGPQVPTIDSRLHMSKMWEVYKGFGSMDQIRRADIKRELNRFWIEKLGQNEWRWRGLNQIEFMSRAILKNTMTEEIGWLNLPMTENIFTRVEAGAKRKQIEIKTETDLLDEWSQWIYDNMGLLQPPYSPIEKKETRFMALRNLVRDIYKKNTDPRTFQELGPADQKFLEKGLGGNILIAALDDRIIKIHTLKSSDLEKIDVIAQRLLTEVEKTNITPITKSASQIIRHIARRTFPDEDEFMDKKGIWKKIYDQFLYNWHELYPKGKPRLSEGEESEEGEGPEELQTVDEEEQGRLVIGRHIQEQQQAQPEGNIIEFDISDQDIIDILLERYPDYQTAAEIFMHGLGLCGRQQMTNREMYELSNTIGEREQYGFTEALASTDAVKYRRQQFSGLFAQEMGFLFEEWIDEIVENGYAIPNVLNDIIEAEHARRGSVGIPDFIFTHSDRSKTVTSVKVYRSTRSETLQKREFNPELRALTDLKEKGEDARLLILYRNIGIPHMLTYRIYHNAGDVPPNITFSPTEAGQVFFTRGE